MTVRWKPLLILSGMFFVVAVVGVVAMAWTLVPRSSEGSLKLARTARAGGRLPDAEIYYKQALQFDSKNAAIHEELAGFYAEWVKSSPAERQEALRAEQVDHLVKAVNADKAAKGPRAQLLAMAIVQDNAAEAIHWSREVLKVDPSNVQALYVQAYEALDGPNPPIAEIQRGLKALEDNKAAPVRVAWIKARLAQATGNDKDRDAVLAEAAKITLPADADVTDRMARLRLEALEIQTGADTSRMEGRVKNLLAHSRELISEGVVAPTRFNRISVMLEQTQRSMARLTQARNRPSGEASDPLADEIEVELESLFQKVGAASGKSDLQIYLTHAEHLKFRQQRDRCLQVIEEALALPVASRPASLRAVMGLHAIAVEMSLIKSEDAARFQKAEPHVKALLGSAEARDQGVGHLFQGAMELEQAGVVKSVGGARGDAKPAVASEPKLRSSALAHLRKAAIQLPDISEAQARYGVALVLNQEQSLGRQYLQNALRMGNLDPQYQFWAAWTILQAGYPEEAAPVLDSLYRQLAAGTIPGELRGTLHQLSGELYQARRGPGDLERAAAEFEKALALGRGKTDATLALRQAQIDVEFGRHDKALERLQALRDAGKAGPSAENLAVLIQEDRGRKAEARKLLADARARYPRSAELVGLDAALRVKDGKPDEADKILSAYLQTDPDDLTLTIMRAQLLAENLKRPEDARKVLLDIAERSDNSAPLVQLAQIEMERNDLEAAAATVSKVRTRWKDAASGDILEGQLAIKRGNVDAALGHFNEAIKKDPENKVIQYWKAQLDSRAGNVEEASKTLEAILKGRPTKEVDTGLSLTAAAQSTLAGLSLQSNNIDDAIRRFEELRKNSETGTLSRTDRWKLIAAYVSKGQWPAARRELAGILNDPKNPPSVDERVQGATFYRQHKEDAAALAQLNYALKLSPGNPVAVVTRANIHMQDKQYPQAVELLRRAIALGSTKDTKPAPILFLMLAAVENDGPPAETVVSRTIAAIDQGLESQPDAPELIRAKYLVLTRTGDPKKAIAFVESKAKARPGSPLRRMLVEVLREQQQYADAERVLRELTRETPNDANLAAALVQVISLQAGAAAEAGESDRVRTLNETSSAMIRDYRAKFPSNLAFLVAECDLVARGGDYARALTITQEMDKVAPRSVEGPMLRARLFAMQGRLRDVARSYATALERNAYQDDLRVRLAQTYLELGETESALEQARIALAGDKSRLDAALIEARALAGSGSTPSQQEARRREAITRLESVIAATPKFAEAYRVLSEIELARGRGDAALSALRRGFKANPDDVTSLSQLVQLLARRGPDGRAASATDLEEARRIAAEVEARDKRGPLVLALAVGFHRSGEVDLALPLSEKAAKLLDTPVAHLNLGDLLMALAESKIKNNPTAARPVFQKAVDEYDRVIKAQPFSVEAVNNKAWVLHTYLDKSDAALELTQGLIRRANPAALPGEFYDTVGSIQEKVGRPEDAERSYLEGLKKSPDLPVLNYHIGKLLAGDRNRTASARAHLGKALAARGQLSPEMARDAEQLVQQITRAKVGN